MGRRTIAGLVACFVLVAVACGDDGDTDAGSEPEGTPTAETPDDSEGEEETDQPEDEQADPAEDADGASVDANTAVVTVGDETYEFDVEAHVAGRCDPDFFGAFWVLAVTADGSNGNLEMFIVPEGNTNHDETSKIKVGVEDIDGRDWRADEDGGEGTPEGQSRVDSFTIDGDTVSGSATFVDVYAGDGATAQGEFTATCPPS